MELDAFIQDVATGAGRILMEWYHSEKVWRAKSDRGDIVTEVDEISEKYILGRIQKVYPDDHILSEEAGSIGEVDEDRRTWIIDPLDGTRNYITGIPFFCVSIGVTTCGRAEAGAVYDPMHDEMFYARRGQGARLNGEPISVSPEKELEDSIVSVSWVKRKADRNRFVRYIEELSKDTSYFRRFGSAALVLCYVACGRLNAYMQAGLNPWDVAAGAVIIEEAGGSITDFAGRPLDLRDKHIEVVTANPDLHSLIMDKVIGRR